MLSRAKKFNKMSRELHDVIGRTSENAKISSVRVPALGRQNLLCMYYAHEEPFCFCF